MVLAIGAHKSRKLGIPGEDKQGVLHGTDFLREVGSSSEAQAGAATRRPASAWPWSAAATWPSTRRAPPGAWAQAKCTSSTAARAQDMPAYTEEIEAAEHEGIQFHFLANPIEVLGDDQ